MCGIAGFHSLDGRQIDRAGAFADELLHQIVDRGKDATGLLTLGPNGDHHLEKAAKSAFQFTFKRQLFPADSRTVLLHTRWATTGVRTSPRDAHPQVHGRLAAIHNGTIHNADELFTAFSLERNAKVDSEIIPALIGYGGWSQAEQALALMRGGCATAVVNFDHPDEVLLARIRSFPLVVAHVPRANLLVWASTRAAIERAWLKVYGSQIVGPIEPLAPGVVVRVEAGQFRTTKIEGVYGVETDRWIGQKRGASTAKTVAPKATAKVEKAKGKTSKSTKKERTPVRGGRRKWSAEESRMRAAAMISDGGTNTVREIARLLDELDRIRKAKDRLEQDNAELQRSLFEANLELDLADQLYEATS